MEQEQLTSLHGDMTSQGLIANQRSPTILDLYSSDSAGLMLLILAVSVCTCFALSNMLAYLVRGG